MKWLLALALAVSGLGVAAAESPADHPAASGSAGPAGAPSPSPPRWCASELEELPDAICVVEPVRRRTPTTLVLFLHGVVHPDQPWQWAQQRAVARAAGVHGFVALLPRGRRGIGPRGMEDHWAWPTSARAQATVETALQLEWSRARTEVERRLGRPFERTYVFGFSNGAYYATSLALRGRLPADGFAAFAGGSGAEHLVAAARAVRTRPPIYVGYGTADRAARTDAAELDRALGRLDWPHRVAARRGVGHTMTDSMVREALEFLAD